MTTGAVIALTFAVGVVAFLFGLWLGFDIGQSTLKLPPHAPPHLRDRFEDVQALAREEARRAARERKQKSP